MTEKLEPVVAQLDSSFQFAERGIVSKTIHESPAVKILLMCFEPGQALSEHTAPFEAVIHVLMGSADIKLGTETFDAKPGGLYVMPAGLTHAVTAKERFVFLLTMIRTSKPVQIS
jgi:quercetin dioxygenase-like cupin family protein